MVRFASNSVCFGALMFCIWALSSCHKHAPLPLATQYVVVDDLGDSIAFTARPRRIVSLAPSITEMIYALRCDSLLVGVTKYCDFPKSALSKTVVGDMIQPSIERIVSLRPEVIFMSVEGNTKQTYFRLKELKIPVFVTNPRTLSGVLKSVRDIGRVLLADETARKLTDSLRTICDPEQPVSLRADAPKLLMLLSFQPIIAVGADNCLHEIIQRAGARNIGAIAPGNYPTLNREAVLTCNPDILLFPNDLTDSKGFILQTFPEWRRLQAIRSEQIHIVDANVLLRPGPRVFQGLELVRSIVREYMAGKQ